MFESMRGRKAGNWWPCKPNSATFYCATCSQPMSLANYQFNDDGTLSPSVVCPYPIMQMNPFGGYEDARCPEVICQKCGFHDNIKLVGWVRETGEKIG